MTSLPADGDLQRMPDSGFQWRSFRPWVLGGLAWVVVGYLILQEYLARTDGEHLGEICLFLMLLWWQFAFAGFFQALRHGERWKLPGLTAAALLPPGVLCLTVMLGG